MVELPRSRCTHRLKLISYLIICTNYPLDDASCISPRTAAAQVGGPYVRMGVKRSATPKRTLSQDALAQSKRMQPNKGVPHDVLELVHA